MKNNPLKFLFLNRTKTIFTQLQPRLVLLKNTAGSAEEEFLLVGEKLQEFHRTAHRISLDASRIAESISSQEMVTLREDMLQMSDDIGRMSGDMTEEKDTVHTILTSFIALRHPLSEFEKVVRHLSALCNLLNIEIARLGSSDASFAKLSGDVRSLAGVIDLKIRDLIDKADAAIPSLQRNYFSIENCGVRQKEQGRLIRENIEHHMAVLVRANEEGAKTIQDISAKWQTISRHIGDVVQSLQFHDITRQRIEHVSHSLGELPQKIKEMKKINWRRCVAWIGKKAGPEHPSAADVRPVDLIADTFELEAAQLQSADRDFTEALEKILHNLCQVARDVTAISAELRLFVRQDASGEGSFLNALERDIDELTFSAGDVAQIKKDIACAMKLLSQTAMGMSVFMNDMEKISIEMQRLALNARIHAAHIGDRGATLGVLAESIHHLSLDTASKVKGITDYLHVVVSNAVKLTSMAEDESAGGSAGMLRVQENIGNMLVPLRKIDDHVSALLPQMNETGFSLAEDIERFANTITIHSVMSRDLMEVYRYLREAADGLKDVAGRRTEDQRARSLSDLALKYTMQRERLTHNAATGSTGQSLIMAAAVPVTPASQGDDLGDNVELF